MSGNNANALDVTALPNKKYASVIFSLPFLPPSLPPSPKTYLIKIGYDSNTCT